MEYFVPRSAHQDDESLASFVRRRFGDEMLTRIAQPIVGGIYTADPEKLSLAATLPRFLEMERQESAVPKSVSTVIVLTGGLPRPSTAGCSPA
jgi:oxygen-dependent protoporphyrinogen oxidase